MSQPSLKIECDLTGLSRALNQLGAVLGADSKEMLKVEAGQMAWRISQAFGPASLASGSKKVEKDVRGTLTKKPAYGLFTGNQRGGARLEWLYSGKDFLVGIRPENNQPTLAAAQAMQVHYANRGKTTPAWERIGTRGKQAVMRLNRVRVSKQAFDTVIKAIKANIGQAKASFAFTTARTTQKRIPSWISKHFDRIAGGKAIFNDVGLNNHDTPFLEFGSRAKGVISNPKMANAIATAARQSAKIISGKVAKLLNGYAYDFKTGAVFKPKAETFERN